MPENENEIEPPAPSEGMTETTIDALTESEALPQVNQAAVDAIKAEEAAQIEQEKAATAANPEAPYGYFKNGKPRKRPAKAGEPDVKPLNLGAPTMPQHVESKSMAAALTTSALLENLQTTMISPDFKYTNPERAMNVQAWCKTFDHYGGVELHPAVELAMSHASIIATRATSSSETQTKFALFSAWLKTKFKRKGKKDARTSGGSDAVGQDDVR